MADTTRFKDLLEAQKKINQILQTDDLKRGALEANLQETIKGRDKKYDNLAQTLGHLYNYNSLIC